MSGLNEYDKYDGLGLATLVRNKDIKPSELVEEAISRIEKLNPSVNAVIYKMYEQARKAAEGDLPDSSFKGVPFLLKDLLMSYAGVPLSNGSRLFKDYVPEYDSELTKRFKAGGVIVIGKTNLPEFGLTPVTEPELFGPANNPWDLTRTTGGSSGGSAAAVSTRMVPMAHGGDGGGSIRIPASCCGVFGLKPTRGRNPLGSDSGEEWRGFYCDHVLTRSVRDSAAMLDATAGAYKGAPYYATPPSHSFLSEVESEPEKLRIAFTQEHILGNTVDVDCVKGLEAAAKLCEDLGHDVVEATPQIDGRTFAKAFITILSSETRSLIEEAEVLLGHKASYKNVEPMTWVIGLLGRQSRAPELSQALDLIHRIDRHIGDFFEKYDVMLTPTLAKPPVVTGELQLKGFRVLVGKLLGRLNAGSVIKRFIDIDALAEQFFSFVPYTMLFNVTGQPAMSVPLYWSDGGLPIGMQFVGRYGDEATLFRLAGQMERAKPWFDRLPPICTRLE
jgi:amidase